MGISAEGDVKIERPLPVDGQSPRITELWAWTAIDPLTDTEGIVAARRRVGGGALPLVTGTRAVAESMRPFAEEVVRSSEDPKPVVRLRRFVQVDE